MAHKDILLCKVGWKITALNKINDNISTSFNMMVKDKRKIFSK